MKPQERIDAIDQSNILQYYETTYHVDSLDITNNVISQYFIP